MKNNDMSERLAFQERGADKYSNLKRILGAEASESESGPQITVLDLDLIDDLSAFEHPFDKSLEMDLGIDELAEQIKLQGVLQPILVRRKDDGRYELLAGHRRKKASIRAEKKTIPAIILDVDDVNAKIIVTDTNLGQREKILPSERAKAYKMQLEALKQQGRRRELTDEVDNFGSNGPEAKNEKFARDIVAEYNKTSASEISRYIRLTYLIKPLLDKIDDEEIAVRAGVQLSYLKETEQNALQELLTENDKLEITISLAEEIREASKEMFLTKDILESMLYASTDARPERSREKKEKPVYKRALKDTEKYMKKYLKAHSDVDIESKINQEELTLLIQQTIIAYINNKL